MPHDKRVSSPQSRNGQTRGLTRRRILQASAAGVAGLSVAGFPAILRAQSDPIRLGHLTPLTGFLGQLGVLGQQAALMAIDEINADGGLLGRQVELITEDSVNPGTAVTKVEKLLDRDECVALLGEISSASALAIAEASARRDRIYINTGANSDELRGKSCTRNMFHVEGCNTMYTKTIGQWQVREGLMDGAKWYFVTSDYAFGQDLRRVSHRFFGANGGEVVGDDLVPTNTSDYSPYILNIRRAQPDMVYINLAGVDQTTFLRQYREYQLPFPVSGGVMDTGQFWAAGIESLSGFWQSLWYHGIDHEGARAFDRAYRERFDTAPENQAWGDYVSVKILAKAIQETQSTDTADLVAYLESGAEFDILKPRAGRFRDWDHQLLQEMYVVEVKNPDEAEDQYDIFNVVEAVPGSGEDLELIQPTREENACTFA